MTRAPDPGPPDAPEAAQAGAPIAAPGPLAEAAGAPGGAGNPGPERGSSPASARLVALSELLGDRPVLAGVLAALRGAGEGARPALNAASRSPEASRRSQARLLLAELDRRPGQRRLLRYLTRPKPDLLTGMLLLSRAEKPDFDARPFLRELDQLAQRVAERAQAAGEGLGAQHALLEVLCRERGLTGGSGNAGPLGELFLERVLTQGRGLPLALVALCILVGQRAGIQATAVPLPGRVLLRIRAGQKAVLADPFANGRLRTRRECVAYLQTRGLAERPEWFHDASASLLLQRHLLNLERAYGLLGRPHDAGLARFAAEVTARTRLGSAIGDLG